MKRRKFLAGCGCATSFVFAGCIGNNGDEETDANDENAGTEEEDGLEDMSGGYDFSSCEYSLNDEKINVPLDESQYNNPAESDQINVETGYIEDVEDNELSELNSIFEEDAHFESSQIYSTDRSDPIDKCDVAKLSNRDYVEYIIPFPVDS